MNTKIAVIGAGNMGEAIIMGIASKSVIASDTRKDRLTKLKHSLKIKVTSNNRDAVRKADIIILAIKPQDMDAVLLDIACAVTSKKLVVSIAAGITTKKIEKALSGKIAVIRVMPNTPALVGMGMSVICPGKYAKSKHVRIASRIFSAMGEIIVIKKERLMDAVTAVSGSGPAYVYLFIESLVKSAKKVGLSKTVAEELVLQTLKGAVELLDKTGKTPFELRRQVTSPGGTTQAALKVFQKKGFQKLIESAVSSACRRSKELQSSD